MWALLLTTVYVSTSAFDVCMPMSISNPPSTSAFAVSMPMPSSAALLSASSVFIFVAKLSIPLSLLSMSGMSMHMPELLAILSIYGVFVAVSWLSSPP